jgi:hypothetical protein
MLTATEYVAKQTERVADALAHFISTTPEDRLAWHVSGENGVKTRSILEQTAECIAVNRHFAALLRGTVGATRPEVNVANGQDAQEQLVISARELAEAIRALSPEDLMRTYEHPRGQMLGENFIFGAVRNMIYHAGQLNFIQMLYGDTEFHVPPTWR